jgi:RNA polymerase sigma-B factor
MVPGEIDQGRGTATLPGSPPHVEDAGGDCSNEKLVCLYQESRCGRPLDELLQKNEGLLHYVLKRFSQSEESYEDLFQVARLGLIKAAQRFDPVKGSQFTTYAVAVVDGEVRHHLRDSLLVRQPRWAKALYQRIQTAQSDYYHLHGRSPTLAELAAAVNVREDGVLEIIRVYGAMNLHSLDEPFEPADSCSPDRRLIKSLRQEPFTLPIEDRILLYDALAALSDFQKRLIYMLFFRDLTQQEVAVEMGLTQRTVSREQSKALSRLKEILSKRVW